VATRTTFLPFALPDIDQSEIDALAEVVTSGWITTGPKTRQFEAEFATCVGARHAVAVNSCTAAMHLALEAIGLQRGDEVITTPYTFAASAEVVRYFDAKPVLVDVNAGSFNIDVEQIEAAITSRTKAIIPVHIAGQAADLDAIYAIAQRHTLAVIEDAAHAFPTTYRGRMIGAPPPLELKHAACFSFYATKTIATGEGGMICTDDDEIADRCRIMALHGISKDAWKRYTSEGSWYYEIIAPGFKYNLTDVAAALGLVQLSKLEQMNARRQAIAKEYDSAFSHHPALQPPSVSAESTHPYHLYILRLNLDTLRIDRNAFIERLRAANIGVSVHWIPLHMHPCYRETYGYRAQDYPVAFAEFLRIISLPIYSAMTDQDVVDVINAVVRIADEFTV
jgi:perosamine synthetase